MKIALASNPVIPAQAGIQGASALAGWAALDSRLRGNDIRAAA